MVNHDFGASFGALVEFLEGAFENSGTVTLSAGVLTPFRKPFTPPSESESTLRTLSRLLEGGRPKNIVRLDSKSFYSLASIIFHFPCSATLQKLVYLFIDTIRQYKNEHTLPSVLSGIHGTDLTHKEVKEQGDLVGSKLSAIVLRHLISNDGKLELRWSLAQFLLVLLRVSSAAIEQLMSMDECKYLVTIIENDENTILRLLVCDVVRELLATADQSLFLKSPQSAKAIKDFPRAVKASSSWLVKALDYMGWLQNGKTIPGAVFMVRKLMYDGNLYFESQEPFVASVLQGNLLFLIPKGADLMHLFIASMSLRATIDGGDDSSMTVTVVYPPGDGDRFVNGTKSAIENLTVEVEDDDNKQSLLRALEGLEMEREASRVPPHTPQKISMASAFIDVSSPLDNKGSAPAQIESGGDSEDSTSLQSLRKSPDSRPLAERLRASQEGPTEDDAGAPAQFPPPFSNQSRKRTKPTTSGRDSPIRSRLRGVTMARPTGPARDDSQASNASSLSGLKRRTVSQPLTTKDGGFQKPSKAAADDHEFDLTDDEPARHAKKAKTKSAAQPARDIAKVAAPKQKGAAQISTSPQGKKKKEAAKTNAKKSSQKKPEPTVAASRSRRAVKSTRYVEASDEDEEDQVLPDIDEDPEEHRGKTGPQEKAEEDTVEDSYPLTREQLKKAGQATQASFDHALDKTSSRNNSDEESAIATVAVEKKTPLRQQTQYKATPQREVRRLSESVIPPVSEKLLRRTKVVHFGPGGPQNQGVRTSSVGADQPPIEEDNVHYAESDHIEAAGNLEPCSSRGLDTVDTATELIDQDVADVNVHDAEEAPPSDQEDDDADVEPLTKSPEVQETQPQSPLPDDHPKDEFVTAEAEEGKEQAAAQDDDDYIEADGDSAFDQSYNQEASEYIATDEGEQESSGEIVSDDDEQVESQSLGKPLSPAPRKSATTSASRPQKPDLEDSEDEVLVRSIVRSHKTPASRVDRPSIGLNSILDEEYPQTAKAISAQKLRPRPAPAAVVAEVTTVKSALVSLGPAVTRTEFGKTNASMPEVKCEVSASNGVKAAMQAPQERQALPPPVRASTQRVVTPQSRQPSAIPPPVELTNSMAPPPIPSTRTMPVRAAQHTMPRKSFPESKKEEDVRRERAAKSSKSTVPAPKRVKTRASLPLTAAEQKGANDIPATPASFSTLFGRQKLQIEPADAAADNSRFSAAENWAQGTSNGSITLLNNDDSGIDGRPRCYARAGHEQHFDNIDSTSDLSSPSQAVNAGVDNRGIVDMLDARQSQKTLAASIIRITNNVLYHFGAQEDAVEAKVDNYKRVLTQIATTLADGWIDRIQHEHKVLSEALKNEQKLLTRSYNMLLNGPKIQGADLPEVVTNDAQVGTVQKKNRLLIKSIEALMT